MLQKRKHKISDLMERVRWCLDTGNYLNTYHSSKRSEERKIGHEEISYVLRYGWHEKSKDSYEIFYNDWNYAIRGKSQHDRELRIIISFDEKNMLIIAAIDLSL